MSKVFLAYKTTDSERANVVREKLELLGVPLFVDQKMLSGDNYISTINVELNSAIAVLVLWSEAAARIPGPGDPPNFVLSEAQRGFARGILVAATFERMALDHLPVPFNLFQAPDLSDWIPAGVPAKHREWQKVLQALAKKLDRPGLGDLAIALEHDDYDFQRKFLREYPLDPSAPQIAARLEAVERKAFEARFALAKRRLQQRTRVVEKQLASYREQFEAHILQLRAGQDFMLQLDPMDALDNDDIAQMFEQERIRAAQAEDVVSKASREIAELKDRYANSLSTVDARSATIKELTSELATRNGQISEQQNILSTREREAVKTTEAARQALEVKDARIGELESLTAKLGRQRQLETKRLVLWVGAAAAVAAIISGCIALLIAPNPPTVAELNVRLASLTAQNQSLLARAKTLEVQADQAATKGVSDGNALKAQIADVNAQNQALRSQVVQLKGQVADDATATAALKKQVADLTTQNQLLQKRIGDLQASAAATQTAPAVVPLDSQGDAPALNGFSARNNRDIDGNDIPNAGGRIGLQVANINECASRCLAAASCVALSFDRWKNVCYLKNKITISNLDVRSTIAVKKPFQLPNVSTAETTMELFRNRKLRGDLIGRSNDDTFDACQAKCGEDLRCLGFNLVKQGTATNRCELFNFLDGYEPDNAVDGGYKMQAAQ